MRCAGFLPLAGLLVGFGTGAAQVAPPFKPDTDLDVTDPYVLAGEILTLEGEALVWSESDTQVLIAVDENDKTGRRDGKVDHLFSFRVTQPLPEPLSYRDPSALVQEHRGQLTIVLRSEGQILNFLLEGVRQVLAVDDEDRFPVRSFRHGFELQRYSDSAARRVDLEAIARNGVAALSEGAEKSILDPFTPPPSDGGSGGGGCLGSCAISVNTCPGGSCNATCMTSQGYCAHCDCVLQAYPDCRCGR